MNNFFLNLIIICLLATSVKAESLKNIVINGNKRIADETIKIYGDIDLKGDFDEKKIDVILKN